MKRNLAREVENLIVRGLEKNPLPIQDGKLLRIGKIGVYQKDDMFVVQDLETRKYIAKTYFKASSISIARQFEKGNRLIRKIKMIDEALNKYSNDLQFYKRTLESSKHSMTKAGAEARYDLAKMQIVALRRDLDGYLYRWDDK